MRYTSTGFVQCARANEFEQGARVHELVRVSVGFCAVHAHKSFVQYACAMSSYPCRVLVWNQYGSWAGACANELVCERVCFYTRAWECAEKLMCKSLYLCTVFAHQDFVQCSSVLVRERV